MKATFKYFNDGKEITKTQAQDMFDNVNFTIKDGEVYFTKTVTPISKFLMPNFDDLLDVREQLIEFIKESNLVGFNKELVQKIEQQNKEIDKKNFNSTRHKYNPTTDALRKAEEHQAKNGREENKEAERFGNFLLDEDEDFNWYFRKTTIDEKSVIDQWNKKLDGATKNTFDGKAYGKGLLEDKVTPYDTASTSKEKTGVKHSEGKLFYELDFGFIKQLAERMQQNKENSKYGLWNWKKPMTEESIENLKQALLRHVLAVMEGEYEDDGRLFGHLESISNNAMMINYQLKQK